MNREELVCSFLFGTKLALYFDFQDIHLNNEVINIDKRCKVTYDLFIGEVLIDNSPCNKVKKDSQVLDLITF